MPDKSSILISIKQKYVDSIVRGEKRAEIRRLYPSCSSVSRVYVYVPTPTRQVVGYFDVKEVNRLPVEQLWRLSGRDSALSQEEFFEYLSGKDRGISIHFDEYTPLSHTIGLADLRILSSKFHPPQSFMYVTEVMEKLFLSV